MDKNPPTDIHQDIIESKQAETLLSGQNQVLEMIATGASLPETLTTLIRIIEAQSPGMLGSILLLDEDGVHVRHGAAPSLPAEFVAAVDDQPIGPCAGSCGTAAYRKEAVFVDDIATDPLWAAYKTVALPHGLRASWSTPIFDARRRVLGTFAMYYHQPRLPQAEHLRLIDIATHIAAIAISHHREAVALRESEARYHLLFEYAPDGIVIADGESYYLDANASACQMLGYTHDELIGLHASDIVVQAEIQHIDPALRTIKAKTSYHREWEFRRKDGSVFAAEVMATTMPDGNLLGMIRDITDRKQAETELRKLSLAVEQSPSSVLITNLDGNIEYVNDAFVKMTGYSRDEVIGSNPRIFQSGKTPKSIHEDMWAHLTRGEIWRGQLIDKRKDGSEYFESVQIYPIRQADGRITHYLEIKENITEIIKAEERIERLVNFDQLTGLPNRSLLSDRFKYALSLVQRSGEPLAVMFLDLDHFKNINDTLGHTIGDQLLIEVARRIKATLREEDTVSRQGGDEFMLILHTSNADGAAFVASKLLEAVSQPCQVGQHELITTASIGIAIYPHDGKDFEALLKNADVAMYFAKQEGRNNYRFFTPDMQTHSARTLLLANALRRALERNELQLYYQPQLSIKDGHIIGAEALLRWRHPELGFISPAEFIPIAENGGQIIPIGEWVLRTATKQLKDWMDMGMPPMVMAVNLSSVQFRQTNITELIMHTIDEVGLPHQYLELELTEAATMDDPLAAIEVMNKLHERGIRMSIDDFGTGYSSLSYLKKFKVYKLKIDQSFVRDITDDPENKAIVNAIISMASSLGIQTIAEGVETAEQLAFLRSQGCDEVQGYYFSKPLPAEQFEVFVKTS